MPSGWDGVIFIWSAPAVLFFAPPIMAVAFYWRTSRPKNLAHIVSTITLYVVMWAVFFAAGPLVTRRIPHEPGLLWLYLPLLLSIASGLGTLFVVRILLRRMGALHSAP